LPTPAADIGEGSGNVAPPSPTAVSGEPAGLSLTSASPDSSPLTAQSAPAPAAEGSPGIHRPPQHKPRPRPVAPKTPPQLMPW
jgi:hypothetical protein